MVSEWAKFGVSASILASHCGWVVWLGQHWVLHTGGHFYTALAGSLVVLVPPAHP